MNTNKNRLIIKFVFLIFIYFCFYPCTSYSQFKEKQTFTIYINHDDYYIKASVQTQNGKINLSKDKYYFWYAYNEIKSTQGAFDGKLMQGEYRRFFPNNNLQEKGSFRKGLKNGEWISWFENGNIKETINWKNGKKYGMRNVYDQEGKLLLTERYYRKKVKTEFSASETPKLSKRDKRKLEKKNKEENCK